MSDVYIPSMASTAPLTCFPSVTLHRITTALAVPAAALAVGACFAMTSTQATADEDIILGVGYIAGYVNCDEDTIDKITLQLLVWTWETVKLYSCLRGLRLAAVWFAGTAFSKGLRRRRASTLLGSAPAAAAAAGEVLPGPGGGDVSRSRNVTAGPAPSQAGMIG